MWAIHFLKCPESFSGSFSHHTHQVSWNVFLLNLLIFMLRNTLSHGHYWNQAHLGIA
jgi:hypothetical protein